MGSSFKKTNFFPKSEGQTKAYIIVKTLAFYLVSLSSPLPGRLDSTLPLHSYKGHYLLNMWSMPRAGDVQSGTAKPVLGLGLSAHFREKN